jgi:hypothetical protein
MHPEDSIDDVHPEEEAEEEAERRSRRSRRKNRRRRRRKGEQIITPTSSNYACGFIASPEKTHGKGSGHYGTITPKDFRAPYIRSDM